ncbi:hypothetical protein [Carboxylicivirga caseinilyticus]|uniref:hypothetical protein n=1 Tax=Carboxylicivirga caseinilyticus TaxID=3417572 RepID=UPI003D347404|nr:hypothetical protein [Marinilabiliaceae bacterium A049]
MKTKFIQKSIFLLLIFLTLFIGAYLHGNKTYISITMAWIGCTIGWIIGAAIREKMTIINIKKFKSDLIILFSCTLIGSSFIAFFVNSQITVIISVISLNIILGTVLLYKNRKNIQPKEL